MISSAETYKLFAGYYDLYVRSYSEDLEFYKSFCDQNTVIIEIGCGTGRILKYLLESGLIITGVDTSEEMLEIARKKLINYLNANKLILLNHNFSLGKLKEKFDVALVTFYTFNYIINNPAGFLKNVYKTLNKNGILIMDLFYPQSLIDRSFENEWRRHDFEVNGRKIKLSDKRWMDNLIEHRIQIYNENSREIQIDTQRRYYSPEEIKEILEQSGFCNIQFSLSFQNKTFVKEIHEKELVKNFVVIAKKK